MIITQVRFELREPMTLDAATALFESTAPRYKGRPGLQRKYYIRSDDGLSVGGLYFWDTRKHAEDTYTVAWRAMVSEKYGVAPRISYFDVPVMVDNT